MPLAFRGMRSRAVTGFVSKFTYRSAPHRSPAPQRVSDTQGVLPFAARGRRSAPRPPHGTARRCRRCELCGDCVRGSRRPVPEHHRKYML
jgi:hypothetical protein